MFTMAPAFDSRSAGKSAFVSRIAANRLSAKAACHSSSGMDATPCGNPLAPPALFTRMSRPPRASSAPAATAFTPEAEATSPATNAAPAGKASPRERAVTTTFAPASRRRCAIPAPMPRVPPVTSARRPMSSFEKSSLLDMRFPFDEQRCVLRTAPDPHEPSEVVRGRIEIGPAAGSPGLGRSTLLLMDALSAVLAPVRLQQTCWAFTVGRAPWGLTFSGRTSCVRFHYVVRGSAWLNVDNTNEPAVPLPGVSLAVLPLGHAHALRDHPRSASVNVDDVAQCGSR